MASGRVGVDTMAWVQFFLDAGLIKSFAVIYATIFAENRIRPDMLADLNNEYLKDMGILAMGDKIAILKHAKRVIEKLRQQELDPDSVSDTADFASPAFATKSSQAARPESPPSSPPACKRANLDLGESQSPQSCQSPLTKSMSVLDGNGTRRSSSSRSRDPSHHFDHQSHHHDDNGRDRYSAGSSSSSRSRVSEGHSHSHSQRTGYSDWQYDPPIRFINDFTTIDSASQYETYANRNNKYDGWSNNIPIASSRSRSDSGGEHSRRSPHSHSSSRPRESPPRHGAGAMEMEPNSYSYSERERDLERERISRHDEDHLHHVCGDSCRHPSAAIGPPIPVVNGEEMYETLDSRYKCKSEKISRNYDGPSKLRPSFFL